MVTCVAPRPRYLIVKCVPKDGVTYNEDAVDT